MARKNTLGLIPAGTASNATEAAQHARPSQKFRTGGALGSVAKSLGSLAETASKADALEKTLREGTVIVDIDPQLVDDAFVRDRLETKDDGYQELKAAIEERGQLSPVLVRPHPSEPGRYQIAFGHRRVMVCRELQRPVKAAVKELTDHELVVALGQENSMRTDLSFLERALFAQKLETEGYDRPTVMLALGVDKTLLSRMLTIVERIPSSIVNYVGRSPSIGRTRWQDLSHLFRDPTVVERCVHWLQTERAQAIARSNRFKAMLKEASKKPDVSMLAAEKRDDWVSDDKNVSVHFSARKNRAVIDLKPEMASTFSQFLISELPTLYKKFQESQS
ncbi:plasmid partitioning protein RepB [Gluconobacter oxydans]|uniref:plasmid partitioning protein RepB n=1 Tax=Gluconobacter oxydans TaxID=442 RepID=UPI0039EA5537